MKIIQFEQIIGIKPEQFERCKSYHAAAWTEELAPTIDGSIQ